MFQMVVDRLFIPELSKIDNDDKKLCAVAVIHLLCDSEQITKGIYLNNVWLPLLQALLRLFESTNQLQSQDEPEEELIVGLDDTPGNTYYFVTIDSLN